MFGLGDADGAPSRLGRRARATKIIRRSLDAPADLAALEKICRKIFRRELFASASCWLRRVVLKERGVALDARPIEERVRSVVSRAAQ